MHVVAWSRARGWPHSRRPRRRGIRPGSRRRDGRVWGGSGAFGGLLRKGEGVGGDVRGRDGSEARHGRRAAAGARADEGGGGAEARVRAVLQRDGKRLAGARLGDAQDVGLGDVAVVVDVARRGERRRRTAADGHATRPELSRGEAETRSGGDADRQERCGQCDAEDSGEPLHFSSPPDRIGAGPPRWRPARYRPVRRPSYETTTEMPVTALASTLPDVEMFAVVPDAGSVPVISAPTVAPAAPVSWILYDLLRQAAGMLERFTWLTE